MNSSNSKTMAVVAVVLVAALLFSWQYAGQDDDGEDMLGDWATVAVTDMRTSVAAAQGDARIQCDVTVRMSDGLIVYGSDEGEYRFHATSDCEAVSVDDGAARQLYLKDGVLYMLHFTEVSAEGVSETILRTTILTRDGTFDFGTEDIPRRTFSASAKAFDTSGVQTSVDISAEVESKLFLGLHMTLTVDGVEKSAVAFFRNDGNRLVISGVIPGSMTFSIVSDGSSTAISALDTSPERTRYMVADPDGLLTDDVLGIGSRSGLAIRGTEDIPDAEYRYDGGFMHIESARFSGYCGVYMPGLHGEGTYRLSAGTVMLIDDGLELIAGLR